MELWRLWVLKGPSVWGACPVIEIGVDVRRWADQPPGERAVLTERLRSWLPSLSLECSGPAETSCLAQILAHLVLHLQTLAGTPVQFCGTASTDSRHRYRVAFEYREEPLAQQALQVALALVRAAWEDNSFALDAELAHLRSLANGQRLGSTTLALLEAARTRQIPVDHFNPDDPRYLRLGQGARQRRTLGTDPDDISALPLALTRNRHLTKLLLREAGVPVPAGRPVLDVEDAWKAAGEIGLPVTIKPHDGDRARGVRLHLRTRAEVQAAYEVVRAESSAVLVECSLSGVEHRLLVIQERVVAVVRIEPPHVVGDGVRSIGELVASANRDLHRGEGAPAPLRRLSLDAVALEMLEEQGHTWDSIPVRGESVFLRRDPPHLDQGGWARDVTNAIHPGTAAVAVAAVEALGMRVASVDVMAQDIARPLEGQGGGVIAVHPGPDLRLETSPGNELPLRVGSAILASLFPAGCEGRIPVVAISGSRARVAGRCLAALLTEAGQRVGRVSRDGVFVAGRKLTLAGATPHDKARAVLHNVLVDAVVLECEGRDLLRQGFACDRCDVVLVTDPLEMTEDADADAEEATAAWLTLMHALAADGKAVLNADDPPGPCPLFPSAESLVWFARSGDNVVLSGHRTAGGRAVFLSGDSLVIARGGEEQRLAFGGRPVERDPRERVALLAALAGAMSLNQCGDEKPSTRTPANIPMTATLSPV